MELWSERAQDRRMQARAPRKLAVVALGGNALLKRGEPASLRAQRANVRLAARAVARLARSYRLVVTHGNGPQVGNIMLRSELAAAQAYPLTLDAAVAESEGELGYLIQQALRNELRAPVVSLLTQAVVSRRDPAFRRPTKPIGSLVDERAARALRRKGVAIVRERGGWRRVVPSPRPLEIIEADAVQRLARAGFVVIAAGGGGVPVVRREGKISGVEAVVDKDRASAVLAVAIGASRLFLLTDVDGAYLEFGTRKARRISHLTPGIARRYLAEGQFPEGSMGPKVEAGVGFVEQRPGGRTLIGSLSKPESGTVITSR